MNSNYYYVPHELHLSKESNKNVKLFSDRNGKIRFAITLKPNQKIIKNNTHSGCYFFRNLGYVNATNFTLVENRKWGKSYSKICFFERKKEYQLVDYHTISKSF